MKKDNLLKKTEVLAKAIAMLAPLYHDKNLDESQRGLLETLVGAGIWYLPNSKVLFSGKISKAALEKIKTDSKVKLVQEHGFPRKVAGNKLFTEHLIEIIKDTDALCDLFLEKFGRYNLVLKEENLQLKKYQKTALFVSEDEAYNLAGIELVNLEDGHFNFPQLKKYMIKEIEIIESEEIEDFETKEEQQTTTSPKKTPLQMDENKVENLTDRKIFNLSANDKNAAQQYKRFIQFVIDNFSHRLEENETLKKYFTRDRLHDVLGAARNYDRVKSHEDYFYSNHLGKKEQQVRIKRIAEELNIEVVA
jgi:hypothetical protein